MDINAYIFAVLFLLLKICHKLQHTCLCVAIAIVARATSFFESVDSTVRLTAMIVEAGTLGTLAC